MNLLETFPIPHSKDPEIFFTTEAQRAQSYPSFARSGDTDRAKKLSPSGITLVVLLSYLSIEDNIS